MSTSAIAVCQGLAEVDMCLTYLVEGLATTLTKLQPSHKELATTQNRLVQTERLASMGQISAGVAHEINNPLSTILLYSHMLLKQHQTQDPENEDIQMIVNEATRCRYIMRGLLDFARQSRVVKALTDLGMLIREVVANLSLKAGGTGITVSCEIQDELPQLMLAGEQIRQMLTNLVQNGVDSIQGEGEVTVSAGIAASEGWGILRVRDPGAGLPPEVIKQLFTPFFTTKQPGQGRGMGLAIVYGVVKMHSGGVTGGS